MKAKNIIQLLQENPESELVICECRKYDDNIPLIPIKSIEPFDNEDSEQSNYYLMFSFDTKTDVSEETKNNIINLLEEDLWCVHKYLDDLELPRTDDKDELYSIVGRIKRLEAKYLKQLSDLETMYLRSEE